MIEMNKLIANSLCTTFNPIQDGGRGEGGGKKVP